MELVRYDGGMIRELATVYNVAIQHVPHCYKVSRTDFEEAVAPAVENGQSEQRHSEAVIMACEGDSIVGFAHVAVGRPKRTSDEEVGIIRFLWYAPGNRQSGTDLVWAAERYLADCGMATVVAYPQQHIYWFYHLGPAYLSDHLGHVAALLGVHGYRRAAGEVFLDWRNFEVGEPPAEEDGVGFSVERHEETDRRPRVIVRALRRDEKIGVCVCASASQYARARPAQDWIFTEWLGVEEAFQGRGLGRALLHRALWEALRLGYRHAAISTAWDNYRAFVFYSNFGYRVVDWTYGLRKELSVPAVAP